MSATQGTYREYETIFIMRPDSTDQITDSVKERINGVMDKLDGKLVSYDSWGKRKLAFAIRDRTGQKNHYKGLYFHLRYVGDNALVPELERNLRMLEPVLRYMTIKLDEDFDLSTLEEKKAAGSKAPVSKASLLDRKHDDDDDSDDE